MPPTLLRLALAAVAILAVSGCSVTAPTLPEQLGREPTVAPEPPSSETALPEDEWIGYFDARAEKVQDSSPTWWGTFGPRGGVAAGIAGDQSLNPGRHVVSVTCAGPITVRVSIIPGGDVTLNDDSIVADLRCASGGVLDVETDVQGLTVIVDSLGERGAYLVTVDPAV